MKKQFHTFYFSLDSPLHISDARLDYGSSGRMLHSDTIYAAVISALARSGNLPDEVVKTGDLGCTISSLLPFTTVDQKRVCFFPRPFLPVSQKGDHGGSAKKIKKVKWLDQYYFESVINQHFKGIEDNGQSNINGEFLSKYSLKDQPVMFTQTVPRAKIPRSKEENNGDTTIFYMERIHFTPGSGLYLMAEGDTSLLEKGLKILQHEGIGTDRNIGQGTFQLEPGTIEDLNIPENNQYGITLGLFCPHEDDVSILTEMNDTAAAKKSRWDLIKRGGWITTEGFNGIRKKSIWMFTEGSVFRVNQPGIHTSGRADIDLSPEPAEGLKIPEHPVWRCGRTLILPVLV